MKWVTYIIFDAMNLEVERRTISALTEDEFIAKRWELMEWCAVQGYSLQADARHVLSVGQDADLYYEGEMNPTHRPETVADLKVQQAAMEAKIAAM